MISIIRYGTSRWRRLKKGFFKKKEKKNKQEEKIHEEYYPQIEKFIRTKAIEKGLSEEVCKNVKRNFISIMMNHFYSEYFESEFLKKLLIIYLSGHIPCGITGNRETGTIMVY